MEQKDNRGALFVNNKKETETQPDRTGTIRVDGVDYWLNGWLNESKSGVKYMSLSVKKKESLMDSVEFTGKTDSDLESDSIPF